MTVSDWIRENYAEHGRDYVMDGMELCRDRTGHKSSPNTWNRQVRRIIREMEGTSEPEESYDVKTLEDAMDFHDVEESGYSVRAVRYNTWGSPMNPNQQVRVDMVPKEPAANPEVWARAFKDAVENVKLPEPGKMHKNPKADLVHLISVPDIHFGKLVYAESIGGAGAGDYNPQIASEIFRNAIEYLSVGIDSYSTKEIIFPIGEDMANVDNLSMKTTAGTEQHNSDVYLMIRTALEAVFTMIDYLATLSTVRVPQIAGNHDRLISFLMGIALEERYRNDPRVIVENDPVREKVYCDGNYSILLIHGDRMKAKDIAWRFPSKYPKEWGNSIYRYVFSGHLHTNLQTDEQGVIVTFLPSLAPTSIWEDSMNFRSVREAQRQTFSPDRGRIATLYYSPQWGGDTYAHGGV